MSFSPNRKSRWRGRLLAEALGFEAEDKLLIVHADDLGISHSVNSAAIQAFQRGRVSSGSVMVTCPGATEVAEYTRRRPRADIGLHVTLTSPPDGRSRWGPVSPPERVPTLVDEVGIFHSRWERGMEINPAEVAVEARAQIEAIMALGIRPTHIDSHQFVLYRQSSAVLDVFLELAREYQLPALLAYNWRSVPWGHLEASLRAGDVVIDRALTLPSSTPADAWTIAYAEMIRQLNPGVSEIIIHPGFDDEETRAYVGHNEPWGTSWRRRDFDFFTSSQFVNLLDENHIQLISWRQIQGLVIG